MYPNLFGINDFSYTLCLIIGIGLAFLIAILFLKKKGTNKEGIIDLLICACFAIVGGIVFAILFENFYELIEKKDAYQWTWAMTFYGGLFGGVFGFLLTYFFLRKNINFKIMEVVKVAPVSIAAAHCIGRIGCFLSGCCYGKPTDSWIGIKFVTTSVKVIPTQLFEAIFLAILFVVMLILLIKKDFKYNFVVYMSAYSVFRFINEFFRGDPRGVALVLSPSQIWCIILFAGATPIYFFLKWLYEKK